MAVKLKHNNKVLVLINIYRILITSSNSPFYALTQYNKVDSKVKSTSEYRKEIFE